MNSSRKISNNRILVVDDEEDVLDFLGIFLGSLGWSVTSVSSSLRALEEVGRREYFLVITDIAMPDMDGYEFVTTLRRREAACRVALMTGFGYNPKHTLVKINRSMRCPFYFKPFDRTKLAEGVQQSWIDYHRELLKTAASD